MTTHVPTGIDLADPTTFVEHDLTGFWRGLRDGTPVYWNPESEHRPGFWVLSRHRDVVRVYRDTENFSSAHGNVLDTLLHGGDSASGKMLAISDGPRHRELRRTLLRSFAPRALRSVEENMRSATGKLVAAAVRQGTCDFAADVAAHIPLATICDMLGVPDAQRAEVQRTAKWALAADEPGQDAMRSWLAKNEILMYFAKLARTRAGDPGSDVVSMLATCEVNGRRLSEDEIILNCYGLVLGGEETTRLTMIGAVAAFLAYPGQWRRLRDGEVDLATSVDEILRWTTVTRHVGRRATADVRVHDTLIRRGDVVTLWHASANFDEREFADPATFDLSRKPNNHLVFGHGPHFCIGAYLGRAEISALLSALRDQVEDFEATVPPENLYSTVFSGHANMPVRLIPAVR